MSKNQPLTKDEFLRFKPNERTVQFIEQYLDENNLEKEDVHILDWGCGRGLEVIWLREQGYNAYGIDIDLTPLENGRALLRSMGLDHSILQRLPEDGKTDFPENFFSIVISNQVLEHVEDLNRISAEMHRIMKPGAAGFHRFPAAKRIREVHLYMPFIQWLPKNRLRKFAIAFYVYLNVEPGWDELEQLGKMEKAQVYYEYSVQKTYYRNKRVLKKFFEKKGFRVRVGTEISPRLMRNPVTKNLLSFWPIKKIVEAIYSNFIRVELHLRKLHGDW